MSFSSSVGLNQLGIQNNFARTAPEDTAELMIAYEKNEYQKERLEMKTDSPFFELLKKDDSYWQDQSELYCKIEKFIRENKDKIPTWQVAGPLHYGMTLSEMKTTIQQQFQKMAAAGTLMKEKSLTETQNRTAFYPADGKGDNNLTRIWGAEFLQAQLADSSLKAAEHYLIIDNEATEIVVQVWHNDYPILSLVENAYILSQKIDGESKAWDYRFSETLDGLKYRDFKDSGNIIRDSNGIRWIVDTELKSFDPPSLNRSSFLVQNYLKKRFKVLSGNDYSTCYQTFKTSVADLGLK